MKYIIVLITLITFHKSFGQYEMYECTTRESNSSFIQNLPKLESDLYFPDCKVIRVKFHNLHYKNGNGGYPEVEIKQAFAILCQDYKPYNITFKNEGIINYYIDTLFKTNYVYSKDFGIEGKFLNFKEISSSNCIDVFLLGVQNE